MTRGNASEAQTADPATPPKCDRFYCTAPAEPGLSDTRCVFHSEDPHKARAPIHDALGEIRQKRQASCRGWVFHEAVSLRESSLLLADFRDAIFLADADFERTNFAGAATFSRAVFHAGAVFTQANLAEPPLIGKAEFVETVFRGRVSFFLTRFDDVDFSSCQFHGEAVFDRAAARRLVFTRCQFTGAARCRELSASDAIAFVQDAFLGRTDFDRTDMTRVSFSFCDARVFALSGAARLSAAEFHGTRWPPHGVAEEQDAIGATDIQRYRDAERVYRELRRGAEDRRQYSDADWAYRRELEMRRLAYRVRGPRWVGNVRASLTSLEALYRILSDYGSSLWHPLAGLLICLALFPYLVAWSGLAAAGVPYTLGPVTDLKDAAGSYWALLGLGVRVAALLPEPANTALSPGAEVIVVLLRIAGPFFGFLFSLAVRRQLRR